LYWADFCVVSDANGGTTRDSQDKKSLHWVWLLAG
jgi:hypothetical protein